MLKRLLVLVFIFLAFIIAVIFLGPRIPLTVEEKLPELPPLEELVQFLADSENSIPGLRENNEKFIKWVNPENPSQTPLSIVYLHGFTASRNEIEPVPSLIAEKLGANLFSTRFAGHGEDPESLRRISIRDWSADALEALAVGKALGERVILIGTSNGAAWATWLAANSTWNEGIAAAILVAPNFHPADDRTRMLNYPWSRFWMPMIQGQYRESKSDDEDHASNWYNRYPFVALFPLMGTVLLLEQTDLENVRMPILGFYSELDRVVRVEAIKEAFQRFPNDKNRLIEVEVDPDGDTHVITGRIRNPDTIELFVEESLSFIKKVTP